MCFDLVGGYAMCAGLKRRTVKPWNVADEETFDSCDCIQRSFTTTVLKQMPL
jgi:hypothetical protein